VKRRPAINNIQTTVNIWNITLQYASVQKATKNAHVAAQ